MAPNQLLLSPLLLLHELIDMLAVAAVHQAGVGLLWTITVLPTTPSKGTQHVYVTAASKWAAAAANLVALPQQRAHTGCAAHCLLHHVVSCADKSWATPEG
jgi:hypothetical protein